MQVYRRMDIGTAKPTLEEMQGIPHHMLDVCDPEDDFSVSRYCEMATPIVDDILARGKVPILVGGTGQYIDSLCAGRTFSAFRPESGQRERLQKIAAEGGLPGLWEDLQRIDPEAAEKLHPNDERRIIRALEIWYETGKTMTEHNLATQQIPPRYQPLWLGLDFEDRAELYRRIDRRVSIMLEQGLIPQKTFDSAANIINSTLDFEEFFWYPVCCQEEEENNGCS